MGILRQIRGYSSGVGSHFERLIWCRLRRGPVIPFVYLSEALDDDQPETTAPSSWSREPSEILVHTSCGARSIPDQPQSISACNPARVGRSLCCSSRHIL